MKRIFAFFAAGLMLFSVAGCGGEKVPEADTAILREWVNIGMLAPGKHYIEKPAALCNTVGERRGRSGGKESTGHRNSKSRNLTV